MMKNLKTRRILAILLALVLTLGLLPTSAFAARIVDDEVQIAAPTDASSEQANLAASYHGTVRWSVSGPIKSGSSSGVIDLGTRTGQSWNNESYTIPYLSSLGVTPADGYVVDYVSVAANSSGRRNEGGSFLLSMSGGSMVYYLKQTHTHSYNTFSYYSSQPTCYATGTAVYSCSCGATTTRTVAKLTADYTGQSWVDQGDGTEKMVCRNCNGGASGHFKTQTATVQNVTLTYYDRGSLYDTETKAKSSVFTVKTCTSTRKGYTFLGWSSNPSATTADWEVGDTMTLTANATLHAVWKENTVKIIYKPGVGGNGTDKSYDWSGASHTVKSSGAVGFTPKTGYRNPFLYWEDSDGNTYEAGDEIGVKPAEDLILTAVWQPYYSYLLFYNEGKVGSDTVEGLPSMQPSGMQTTTTYTFTLSDQEPTREGYRFLGWSTTTTGEPMYQPGGQVTVTNNTPGNTEIVNLYALWESITPTADYTVQWFDTLGNKLKADETRNGTVGETVSATYNDKYNGSGHGSIEGYDFVNTDSRNVTSDTLAASGTVLKLYFMPMVPGYGEMQDLGLRIHYSCQDNSHHGGGWQGNYGTADAFERSAVTVKDGKYHFELTVKKDYWETYALERFSRNYPNITHTIVTDTDLVVTFDWEDGAWTQTSENPDFIFEGNDITYIWKDASGNQIETVTQSACIDPPAFPGANLPQKPEDDDNTYDFDKWSDPKDEDGKVVYEPEYTATAKPKLEVEKLALVSGNVKPGDEVKYQITVTNVGAIDVKNVVITDVLNENLVFESASGTGGKSWTVDNKPANGQYEFGDYTLTANTDHNAITLTINAKVADNAPDGTIHNVASVDCPNMPADKPSDTADITVENHVHDFHDKLDDEGNQVWKDGHAPTCTTSGTKIQACSCGEERDGETVAALGHDFTNAAWVDDNQAGEHGDGCNTVQHRQVCNRCHGAEDGGVNRANHTYGEWVVDHAASLTETGLRHRDCTTCDHVQTETIATLDKCTVTWYDEDGTQLDQKEFAKGGEEPAQTIENPTKAEDANNTYTFNTWTREADTQGNVTYTATYTPVSKYTVTWKDGDTTILEGEDKVKSVDDVPEFPGELPEAPEGKEFDKWGDPVVDDETHTITVPIVWKDKEPEEKELTVKWVSEDGNTVLDTKTFKEGEEEPAKTIEDPAKAEDANYTYAFDKWIRSEDTEGNVTYTASYTSTRKNNGGNGGGGGGGNRPVNPPEEDLDDPDVPLANLPMLNQDDHFAYIIGKPDGNVYPLGNITRAEVVTIFFRIMTEEARAENWGETNDFSDVAEGVWYNHAVCTAVNAGLIKGLPDGTFGGDKNITRAEFATIAARFLDTVSQPAETFSDIEGHWAEADINRATVAGWIKGVGDGKFNPDAYITRAEVMTLVNRMLNRKFDESNTLADMVVWPDNMDKNAWYYGDVQEATNDHDYDRVEGTLTETWTKITESRDWSELEK